MAHDEVKHDFHLVNPSPWPLLGSLAVIVTALGGVTYMKGLFGLEAGTWWLLAVGLAMVIWVMFGWWREVIKEGGIGDHTPVVQIGLRYGMILFIASEVMFFVGWFWSFFEFAIYESARVGETWDSANALYADGLSRFADWPPVGVETFDPFHLPLINTLILLLSGTTVTWAHHALQHNDRAGAKLGLVFTVLLGMVFTMLQAYEYSHAAFTFDGTLYGSAFFMATGFHGAHVVIGTIFLAICLIRLLMGGMSAEKHLGFEFAAWYWHFVDVVWLFLFAFVYVVPFLVYGG
ncbi:MULTISPECIES: cytochrome c oxidase subunit 3 [unclassified Hyphomonas]|jgi:cytochrome c oxidase subunit 3|uniref:cytochrome-c oxidase n=3 Tax=root TaxID=1 RepID=A0A160TZB3_9ZZZZ|nr:MULTISPECIES: cytochrome c oxidase subunit 3 [unclassified Hyphomonas]MAN89377.1 cytochrome c oxidase subunit 3 [Hyphomonadaceae bacterium]MAA81030.1 cytochrome c oxidase subunit 3 [Hyphomonas sp.]MAL48017.1 cytochrome c oxidase subunit 3 [Hyphomonas sp.]MBG67023.1 cytochrome c oxidase subunit 3 [Hyphomonas sp.]MBO6583755.1 cytochrome c oxidase subunit 3 [Hyphomonas sp.]|tara:strand:- start:7032 stop:7904 length:873 start_codon:yes stop_codon:yes gene_type:complete